MMFTRFLLAASVVAVVSTMAVAGPVAARTGDGDSLASVACENADSAMMATLHHMTATMPSPDGKIDADFVSMMTFQDSMMTDIAKLEVRCGEKPKVKEAARRFLQVRRTHRFSGDSV